MTAAPLSGARWRRIDFHLHCPGVDSISSPSGINHDSTDKREKFAELGLELGGFGVSS